MRTGRRHFIPLTKSLCLLGLAGFLAFPADLRAATPSELQRDPLLARRVRLHAEAIPLRRVFEALGKETGLTFEVEESAAGERLVAFVPGRPLHELMTGVADLYRLSWQRRERDSGHSLFRLERSPAQAKEEAQLRRTQVVGILNQLEAQLRNPPVPASTRFGDWRPAYPALLPLLQNSADTLSRTGAVSVTVSDLPAPLKDELVSRLQPILDANRLIFELAEGSFAAQNPDGPRIRSSETLSPSRAADCEIIEEVVLGDSLETWIGLRTRNGTLVRWFSTSTNDQNRSASELYPKPAPPVPASQLDRPHDALSGKAPSASNWISQLALLSETSGVPIFADCYQNVRRGLNQHPRAALDLPQRGSVRQVLDTWCAVDDKQPGTSSGHSFWWNKQDTVLVRSRHWLWESQTVLPASLSESLYGNASCS